MSDRSRDSDSRFAEEYTDEDFLEAIAGQDMPTTVDVAEAVGCKRTTAYPRLQRLEESGDVAGKKIGNANVWRLPD